MSNHTDRCCNPFAKPGEKRHRGSNLRSVSANFLKIHPEISSTSKICHNCRKLSQPFAKEDHGPHDFMTCADNVSSKKQLDCCCNF